MSLTKDGKYYPGKSQRVIIPKSDYDKMVTAILVLSDAVILLQAGKTEMVNVQELQENCEALRVGYFKAEIEF